jgi:hypothetical protein
MTVSHRWGQSTTFTLTEANHESLLNGIGLAELPQLYKDFITVARRLGVQYIWIDSLCIVQDSKIDWAHEASLMGNVYRGAVCNIVAAAATDIKSSLFTRSHPLSRSPCLITDEGATRRLWIDNHNSRTTALPLYSRAWVLQERLLAPRTIEYNLDGVEWSCTELETKKFRAPIQGEDGQPQFTTRPGRRPTWNALSDSWRDLCELELDRLTDSERYVYQSKWMDIIREYSVSNLTQESDRIPAHGGIISVLTNCSGVTFRSGVCTNFFPFSLLWSVQRMSGITHTTMSETFPTWSCTFRKAEMGCSFRHISSDLTAGDTTISVCNPSHLLEIEVTTCGPTILDEGRPSPRHNGLGSSMLSTVIVWSAREWNAESWSSDSIIAWLDRTLDLPIMVHPVLLGHNELRIQGLLLAPDSADDTWKRVGIFMMPKFQPMDTAMGTVSVELNPEDHFITMQKYKVK